MLFDIMESLSAFGGGMVGYLVPFLFVLTIVVFFHELGHFLVARLCGIKVTAFSLGFGPEIAGFNDRYGTRWKLSAVPLGGYVKFYGDDNAASVPDHAAAAVMSEAEKKDSFVFQPVASRAAVVAAGPFANFLLAILIFAGIFMIVGKQTTTARVDTVQPASAAAAAGFQPGDLVTGINGEKIDSFSDMQRIVSIAAGEQLTIQVERGNALVTLKATPQLKEIKDNFGNVHRLGMLGISRSMAAGDIKTRENGSAAGRGCRRAGDLVRRRPHAVLYRRGLYRPGGRRSAGRADPYRPGVRPGRHGGLCRPHPPDRRAVGFDRAFEPVPDPAARWRSPFVLWNRGGPWPAAIRAGPGDGLPDRLCFGRPVDDFCNL